MRPALLAAALIIAAPVVAQTMAVPGKPDAKLVQAGTYRVDSDHTQVVFGVSHLGFNPYYGAFSGVTGSLTLDPARPAAAKLDVEIPIASVQTTSDKLTGELKSADWLDPARFPTMRFTSTSITARGTTAQITGNLSLHGVTRPVVIDAKFVGAGTDPMKKVATVGFTGTTTIKRSEFGVAKYVPIISDEMTIKITAAFHKAPPAGS